ncbi:MAG TPA: OmpH family outer membrane protein [Pyrinomonadaceae bacterium]
MLVAVFASSASAQQPAAARPAAAPAQTAGARPTGDAKIAVIQTEFFSDEKNGISRFVAAMKRVDGEFQPRRTEIQGLQQRYQQLVKEINDTKTVADQATLSRKADEAESLQNQIKRKQEDGQRDLEKRMREVLTPLQEDVFKALDAYAKERGISIIIDVSQTPVLYAVESVNITRDFITNYNSRNPATASAATPRP